MAASAYLVEISAAGRIIEKFGKIEDLSSGSIRGCQLPQIRGTGKRNQHEKDSQCMVDFNDFNRGRPFRTCHVAGINNHFEFIHGKSDSAQLRIGGIGGTTNRKTLEMVGSLHLLSFRQHTDTSRYWWFPMKPIIHPCCVFCPNLSQIVSQGVMPTVTDALLLVS